MRTFLGLQDYFLDLYTGKDKNLGLTINIHTFPFLHLDNKLIILPLHKYIILRADINSKHFKNLQTYSAEEISLQSIIYQGLVHAIYGSMGEILHSDFGIAIKEACKKLYYVKGKIKIMFYSSLPKFTPPIRPAMHDIYITKGCHTFPGAGAYELGQEYKEMLSKDTNHDNLRVFNEAKELEENIRFDPSYYMVFQNKIMRIFLPGHQGTMTRYIGRMIKPDYGKDSQLRKEYCELMCWQEMWQPDEIDGTESAPMIDYEEDE
jgi:hypothetical protein